MTSNSERPSLDIIYGLLADERRRCALVYLQKHRSIGLPDLAEEVACQENDASITDLTEEEIKRVYMEFWHVHIPKLVDADIVEYDQERDRVTLAANTDWVFGLLPDEQTQHAEDSAQ